MSLDCAVCGVPCKTSCGGCKRVSYCCKEHQQKDWKKHKKSCFPIAIRNSEILGRYLVTTRDVRQGEILLREFPLISGPNGARGRMAWPVCLSCCRRVRGDFKCANCHWPLCSMECQENRLHKELECRIFSSNKVKPFGIDDTHMYELITVLRGVLQKDVNCEVWTKIQDLQSHYEERVEIDRDVELKSAAVDFIKGKCALGHFREEEIDHVVGAISTNAFVSDDGLSMDLYRNGTYLMHMGSMPAHNCVPNCSWVIQQNSEFMLRASIPLRCGEAINFLYTEPTLPTRDRQLKLKTSKYFLCQCDRCRDSTELGTFFSAVKCPGTNEIVCQEGYLVPFHPLRLTETPPTLWSCTNCDCPVVKDWKFISSILQGIDQELLNVGMEDSFENVEKLDTIRRKHCGVTLHQNNHKIHDVENDILQRISYMLASLSSSDNSSNSSRDRQLQWKWATLMVELSRKCLSLARVIWPGFSRHRGRLLYFLQQGLTLTLGAQLSSKMGKRKSKSKGEKDLKDLKDLELSAEFDALIKAREELKMIFVIEPEGREEFQLRQLVEEDSPAIMALRKYFA